MEVKAPGSLLVYGRPMGTFTVNVDDGLISAAADAAEYPSIDVAAAQAARAAVAIMIEQVTGDRSQLQVTCSVANTATAETRCFNVTLLVEPVQGTRR